MNPTPDMNGPATTEGGDHEEDRGESRARRWRRYRAAARGWRRSEVPLIDPVETAAAREHDRRLHAGQKFRGTITVPRRWWRRSYSGEDVLAGFCIAYLIGACVLGLIGWAAIVVRAVTG